MQITAFEAISARRINIQGCEDYENTFAQMESDCTLRFGFKVLIKSISFGNCAIAKHYKNVHWTMPQDLLKRFEVLKKCRNKFDCLVYRGNVSEMLFIRTLKLNLNVQSDSIHFIVRFYRSMFKEFL